MDIWSAYENCAHLDDALNRLGPDRLRELLAQHRLSLFAFSTYVGGYAKYAELLGGAGGGWPSRAAPVLVRPKNLRAG
ncbi:MAG: hypothetical protein M5U12_02210 [Verrucomicrobia bacterium]|nr:hypothetical protein [Verrucomicrobiota bacterium]